MHRGLVWLAIVDLRRAWVRWVLATAALALAILAVAVFVHQISLRQAELLAEYEKDRKSVV